MKQGKEESKPGRIRAGSALHPNNINILAAVKPLRRGSLIYAHFNGCVDEIYNYCAGILIWAICVLLSMTVASSRLPDETETDKVIRPVV